MRALSASFRPTDSESVRHEHRRMRTAPLTCASAPLGRPDDQMRGLAARRPGSWGDPTRRGRSTIRQTCPEVRPSAPKASSVARLRTTSSLVVSQGFASDTCWWKAPSGGRKASPARHRKVCSRPGGPVIVVRPRPDSTRTTSSLSAHPETDAAPRTVRRSHWHAHDSPEKVAHDAVRRAPRITA
jgi:hypothetical protein